MKPTQERLEASNLTGTGINQRLIIKLELPGVQCTSQLELQGPTSLNTGIHFRLEKAIRSAPIRLGSVHRQIGIFKQLVRTRAVGWGNSETNARTYIQLLSADLIGRT